MKKYVIRFISLVVLIFLFGCIQVVAFEHIQGDPTEEPVKMRCTCYLDSGTTASGAQTRVGIAAGKREWLGRVAAIYAVDEEGNIGDFIGYYEILDTGAGIDTDGDGKGDSIRNGESLDVWQPSKEAVANWVNNYGDYVYIKIIDGKG